MVKFRQLGKGDLNNHLYRWMAFFDKSTDDETLKTIIAMDRAIAKAQEKIAFVLQDEDALHAYQMREMALSDYTSGINHARREGRQEGRQEGIAIGEQQTSQKIIQLLKEGKSVEEISRLFHVDLK
jgi:predicted transposase/invertase (TIGR01784 family)